METEVAWDEESTKRNTRLWRRGFVMLLGRGAVKSGLSI
jgi:hypothetical protein